MEWREGWGVRDGAGRVTPKRKVEGVEGEEGEGVMTMVKGWGTVTQIQVGKVAVAFAVVRSSLCF